MVSVTLRVCHLGVSGLVSCSLCPSESLCVIYSGDTENPNLVRRAKIFLLEKIELQILARRTRLGFSVRLSHFCRWHYLR